MTRDVCSVGATAPRPRVNPSWDVGHPNRGPRSGQDGPPAHHPAGMPGRRCHSPGRAGLNRSTPRDRGTAALGGPPSPPANVVSGDEPPHPPLSMEPVQSPELGESVGFRDSCDHRRSRREGRIGWPVGLAQASSGVVAGAVGTAGGATAGGDRRSRRCGCAWSLGPSASSWGRPELPGPCALSAVPWGSPVPSGPARLSVVGEHRKPSGSCVSWWGAVGTAGVVRVVVGVVVGAVGVDR